MGKRVPIGPFREVPGIRGRLVEGSRQVFEFSDGTYISTSAVTPLAIREDLKRAKRREAILSIMLKGGQNARP